MYYALATFTLKATVHHWGGVGYISLYEAQNINCLYELDLQILVVTNHSLYSSQIGVTIAD